MAATSLKTPPPSSRQVVDPDELILFADSDDNEREVKSFNEEDDVSIDLSDWERENQCFFINDNDNKVKDCTTGRTYNMKQNIQIAFDNDGPDNSVILHD